MAFIHESFEDFLNEKKNTPLCESCGGKCNTEGICEACAGKQIDEANGILDLLEKNKFKVKDSDSDEWDWEFEITQELGDKEFKAMNKAGIEFGTAHGETLVMGRGDKDLRQTLDALKKMGINEGRVQYKRQYTENHPAQNMNSNTKIRSKILEAIADGIITEKEMMQILKELNANPRWFKRNANLFKVTENGICLSKTGQRMFKHIQVANPVNEEEPVSEGFSYGQKKIISNMLDDYGHDVDFDQIWDDLEVQGMKPGRLSGRNLEDALHDLFQGYNDSIPESRVSESEDTPLMEMDMPTFWEALGVGAGLYGGYILASVAFVVLALGGTIGVTALKWKIQEMIRDRKQVKGAKQGQDFIANNPKFKDIVDLTKQLDKARSGNVDKRKKDWENKLENLKSEVQDLTKKRQEIAKALVEDMINASLTKDAVRYIGDQIPYVADSGYFRNIGESTAFVKTFDELMLEKKSMNEAFSTEDLTLEDIEPAIVYHKKYDSYFIVAIDSKDDSIEAIDYSKSKRGLAKKDICSLSEQQIKRRYDLMVKGLFEGQVNEFVEYDLELIGKGKNMLSFCSVDEAYIANPNDAVQYVIDNYKKITGTDYDPENISDSTAGKIERFVKKQKLDVDEFWEAWIEYNHV